MIKIRNGQIDEWYFGKIQRQKHKWIELKFSAGENGIDQQLVGPISQLATSLPFSKRKVNFFNNIIAAFVV